MDNDKDGFLCKTGEDVWFYLKGEISVLSDKTEKYNGIIGSELVASPRHSTMLIDIKGRKVLGYYESLAMGNYIGIQSLKEIERLIRTDSKCIKIKLSDSLNKHKF